MAIGSSQQLTAPDAMGQWRLGVFGANLGLTDEGLDDAARITHD